MPFAGYEDFDACVSDNQDKADPEAYCAAIKNEVENTMSARIAVSRELAEPNKIERIEQSDGSVRYKNVTILSPGEWTDSASRTTYYYSPEGIKNSVENWEDNNLHLNHDGQETILADIGHVDTDSVTATHDGMLMADLVFHRRTDESESAEALMELALDTNGEQGPGGPSVEIIDTNDEWNDERGLMETTEMTFTGVGIVGNPAAQDISFDKQMSMLSEGAEKAGVRMLQKSKGAGQETSGMSESDETPETPIQKLKAAREELAKTLQDSDEMELAIEALRMAESEGFDPTEGSLADLMDMLEGMDINQDMMSAVNTVANAVAETRDAEGMGEIDANEMETWIENQMDEMEETEGEEAEEEENNSEMSELEQRVSSIEESISEVKSELSDMEEMHDEMNALAATLEDVTRELENVKNEPKKRALSEQAVKENSKDDDDVGRSFSRGVAGRDDFSVF